MALIGNIGKAGKASLFSGFRKNETYAATDDPV
jgi:hypothetical protein